MSHQLNSHLLTFIKPQDWHLNLPSWSFLPLSSMLHAQETDLCELHQGAPVRSDFQLGVASGGGGTSRAGRTGGKKGCGIFITAPDQSLPPPSPHFLLSPCRTICMSPHSFQEPQGTEIPTVLAQTFANNPFVKPSSNYLNWSGPPITCSEPS